MLRLLACSKSVRHPSYGLRKTSCHTVSRVSLCSFDLQALADTMGTGMGMGTEQRGVYANSVLGRKEASESIIRSPSRF